MTEQKIKYKELTKPRWWAWDRKYELLEDYTYYFDESIVKTGISLYHTSAETVFVYIDKTRIICKKGFVFGPSGPTFDTPAFMRGACVHDAIYWFIRNEFLSVSWKAIGDLILKEFCVEDGMSKFRANYIYLAVKVFGWYSLQ